LTCSFVIFITNEQPLKLIGDDDNQPRQLTETLSLRRQSTITDTNYRNLSLTTVILSSNDDDYELSIRILCIERIENSQLVWQSIDNIRSITKDRSGTTMVVVDQMDGGRSAATLCALMTMADEIDRQDTIDVYQLSQIYNQLYPGIWKSLVTNSYSIVIKVLII